MNAIIREVTMNERSGLSITSLTGHLFSNDSIIRVPNLILKTPHSEMNLTAQTYWELINIPTTGRLTARFNALSVKKMCCCLQEDCRIALKSLSFPSSCYSCRYGRKFEANANFRFYG